MSNHPPHAQSNERRFFVYFLSDEAGEVLYIGRSVNVANRLRGHLSDASNPDTKEAPRKAMWFADVRKVDVIGPFDWAEAVAQERQIIEDRQPFGNIALTGRMTRERSKWVVA